MPYEAPGGYFVSYTLPPRTFRRRLTFRIVTLTTLVIGFCFLWVANKVQYMNIPCPGCKPGEYDAFGLGSIWKTEMVVPQLICVYVFFALSLALSLASVTTTSVWLAVFLLQLYERRESDEEREAGAEPQVLVHVDDRIKAVRKAAAMYHIDEQRRLRRDHVISVANTALLATLSASTLCAFICHVTDLLRFLPHSPYIGAFFACTLVATFFFLVATCVSAIPYLTGFMCCPQFELHLRLDADVAELDTEEPVNGAATEAVACGVDAIDKGSSHTLDSREKGGDGNRIVLPVYAFSSARGRQLAARESPRDVTDDPSAFTTVEANPCLYPPTPAPADERAPPLYAHVTNTTAEN